MEFQRCPFCGSDEIYTFHYQAKRSKALFGEYDWRNAFGIGCNGCGIEGTYAWDTEEEAIEAWNKRA